MYYIIIMYAIIIIVYIKIIQVRISVYCCDICVTIIAIIAVSNKEFEA